MGLSDESLKADLMERPPRRCRFQLIIDELSEERRQRILRAAERIDPFGGNNNRRIGYNSIATALTRGGHSISDLTVRRHLHPHESCCCGT